MRVQDEEIVEIHCPLHWYCGRKDLFVHSGCLRMLCLFLLSRDSITIKDMAQRVVRVWFG